MLLFVMFMNLFNKYNCLCSCGPTPFKSGQSFHMVDLGYYILYI